MRSRRHSRSCRRWYRPCGRGRRPRSRHRWSSRTWRRNMLPVLADRKTNRVIKSNGDHTLSLAALPRRRIATLPKVGPDAGRIVMVGPAKAIRRPNWLDNCDKPRLYSAFTQALASEDTRGPGRRTQLTSRHAILGVSRDALAIRRQLRVQFPELLNSNVIVFRQLVA
jgi:hypothetical protein